MDMSSLPLSLTLHSQPSNKPKHNSAMDCQLFQIDQPTNDGERAMLNALKRLPARYAIYRELKLDSSRQQKEAGIEKRNPDFVVVSEEVGVVSIEVKHWNLRRNQYHWLDQRNVKKVDSNGNETNITNPVHQADTYKYALMDQLDNVFVSSLVAFPRITRNHFFNQIANRDILENPNTKFYLDPSRTIFRDEIDRYFMEPEDLLKKMVRRDERFRRPSGKSVYKAKERLLPSSFRIGDYTERQAAKEEIKALTEKQQEWVFDLSSESGYLLDMAGSGKTNSLISKALHLVDRKADTQRVNVLVTTYNDALVKNIERIFKHKMYSREEQRDYRQYIDIKGVEELKETIVKRGYNVEDLSEYQSSKEPDEYRSWLQSEAIDLVFQMYDEWNLYTHVFVDEIQDLDTVDLQFLSAINEGQEFFFVGDFGQKIYERKQSFSEAGISTDHIELPKSYQMHRTPQHIARLATEFVWNDERLKREFADAGYEKKPEFPNASDQLPDLERTDDPITTTVERIQDLQVGGPSGIAYLPDNIMVITTASAVEAQREALEEAGISTTGRDSVRVVDFREAKGLEKEIVIVHGIEELYRESENDALFGDSLAYQKNERRLRRILYVALTRPLEQLTLFYHDGQMSVIRELVELTNRIRETQLA